VNHRNNAIAAAVAGIGRSVGMAEGAQAEGVYSVECFDADGNLKWSDTFHNLVLTAGKNDALDKYLAGSAYTAAFYLGLIDSTGYSTIAAGDTAASHAGWAESSAYSQSTRPAASWAAASAGSKALASAAVFSINAAATIKGAFLATVSTKGGTTGVIYSAGLFSGGDKVLANGDTLNVSYSTSL
jgi:hypothetical protein